MLLFQPIVAKSSLIDWFIIFIENRSLAPHNKEKSINIKLKSISTSTDVKQEFSMNRLTPLEKACHDSICFKLMFITIIKLQCFGLDIRESSEQPNYPSLLYKIRKSFQNIPKILYPTLSKIRRISESADVLGWSDLMWDFCCFASFDPFYSSFPWIGSSFTKYHILIIQKTRDWNLLFA